MVGWLRSARLKIGCIGAASAAIMSVVTLISFLALWRINSEKLVLENRLATLSASEASLRLAASQPQFSVQYLRTSSVTWDKLISGSELKPLTSRKTRFAVEAAEHMWEYPIIQTHLADSLSDDLFGSSKEINRELKDEWGSTLADYEVFDINHLLILISAFGGSKARNVRVIYDEYDFVGAKYLFEDYDFTDMFDDDSLQTTVKRDNLSLRKIRKSMQLGDIAPGDGRMIELSDAFLCKCTALVRTRIRNRSISILTVCSYQD